MFTAIVRTPHVRTLAAAAVLVAAFTWAYYPTVRKLVDYWAANETYSFGFVVPVIVGYLIWLKRNTVRGMTVMPSYRWGGSALGAALVVMIVGRASNTNLVEELSLPVAIIGTVLLVCGWHITRALAFPLAFTFAMVPFWGFIIDPLQAPSQLLSATIGVGVLRLFDLAVFRDGVFIYLPNKTLEVADVCSGINQLVAILCLGIPLAYVNISRWSKRAIIVVAAGVIAVVSNGLRVAIISLFAYYGITGPNGDVHGPFSLARTTLISAIGFGILFWLIARFSDKRADVGTTAASGARRFAATTGPRVAAVAVAVALLASTAAFDRWNQARAVPLSTDLAEFPRVVGGWRVVGATPAADAMSGAMFDNTLSRRYAAPDGREVDLLFGYFERQTPMQELVGFEVSRLLSPRENAGHRTLKSNVRVTDFVTVVDGQRHHVTYWYVVDGRILSGDYETKWRSTWNALTKRRNNGAIVIVKTRVDGDRSIERIRTTTLEFVEHVLEASGRILAS